MSFFKILLVFFLISGCAKYVVRDYEGSSANIVLLRKMKYPLKIENITFEGHSFVTDPKRNDRKKNFICRGANLYFPGEENNPLTYIKKSLKNELQMAEKFSERGDMVSLDFTKIYLTTMGNPFWSFEGELTYRSRTKKKFSVVHSFPFTLFGDSACANAMDEYLRAQKKLFAEIYKMIKKEQDKIALKRKK